jgi:hypothetical protein
MVPINPFDLCTENLNAGSEHLQALCHLKNRWICHSAWNWHKGRELTEGNKEENAGRQENTSASAERNGARQAEP